jgi:quinol-cytochrome oxidoreductase complex cytochrome b subunit
MRPSFFHHLHPPTIPAPQARLRYTLGAGGLSVYLVLAIIVTGVLLMFYYVPTPEGAGASIQVLTFLVPYGGLVRNLHYWAAQLLIGVATLHMLRVILTGAYTKPRRFNYLLGLSLLLLSLMLDFTGYVLRWDEGVRWALVAGTNLVKSIPAIGPGLYAILMGGSQPGPATLTRFYAWHIFGLTLILIIIGVWHLFRVRRDGGIAVPPPDKRSDPARITRFELVRREGLAAILATAVLLPLAAFIPAPLAPPMQSLTTPNGLIADSRAPWFFLWVQQLLKFGNAFVMGVLIPLGIVAFLIVIPYLLPAARPEELGRWLPRGGRLAQAATILAAILLLALSIWSVLSTV